MAPIKIIDNQNAQLTFIEEGGVEKLILSAYIGLGGGTLKDVLKFKSSSEIDASAMQLIDAGLLLLAAKFPNLAPGVTILKTLIDAELPKVL